MKKAALFGISLLLLSQLNGTAGAEILNEKALQLAAENNALAQADKNEQKKDIPHKTLADVKSSHWSYQAVKQLTEAGLVEGFDDGMFHGDRNLSRYEMAVIISRAMDKQEQADAQQKIIIQALQDEYSKELKNIGAQIEELKQKVDRVQFHGYFGTRYDNVHGMAVASDPIMKKTTQLSVDTQYHFDKHTMITVSTTFNRSFKSEQADFTNLGALQWVDYNNRGFSLKVGRYATTMGYGLMFNDEKIQGIEIGYDKGKRLSGRFTLAQYKPVTSIEADTDNDFTNNLSSHNLHPALVNKNFWSLELDYKLTPKTNVKAVYQTKPNTRNAAFPFKNWESTGTRFVELGFDHQIWKDTTLTADWVHTNSDVSKNAYKIQLQFGNPWPPVKGKHAHTLAWYNAPADAMIIGGSGGMIGDYISTLGEGFRGWVAGYQWSPINNTIFDVFYMYGRTVDASCPYGYTIPGGVRKKIFRLDFALLF